MFCYKPINKNINNTSLVLDDNLINLINFIKTKIDLEVFNSSKIFNFTERNKEQEKVRELFDKYKNDFRINFTPYKNFDKKKHNFDKPNNFAIHIALISTQEKLKTHNWKNILKNDSFNFDKNLLDIIINKYKYKDDKKKYYCCCSHYIQNFHYIENLETNLSVFTGSHCVYKNLILNEKQEEQLKKQKKIIKEYKKNFVICQKCKKLNIEKKYKSWKKLCKDCWKKENNITTIQKKGCLINLKNIKF